MVKGFAVSFNVGDTVFLQTGQPGVVVGRKEGTNELIVQKEGERFEKTRSRGFINGLSPEQRDNFNHIMDDIRKLENPRDRVSKLHSQIEKMSLDPRLHMITRYLEGELAHIMNTHAIQPKEYYVDETDLR